MAAVCERVRNLEDIAAESGRRRGINMGGKSPSWTGAGRRVEGGWK